MQLKNYLPIQNCFTNSIYLTLCTTPLHSSHYVKTFIGPQQHCAPNSLGVARVSHLKMISSKDNNNNSLESRRTLAGDKRHLLLPLLLLSCSSSSWRCRYIRRMRIGWDFGAFSRPEAHPLLALLTSSIRPCNLSLRPVPVEPEEEEEAEERAA